MEDMKALGQDPPIPRVRWSPQHLGNLSYGALVLWGIILSTVWVFWSSEPALAMRTEVLGCFEGDG